MMRRRGLLASAAALGVPALSGCGFRPLYMPQSGRGGVAETELSAVYVPVMAERAGQLLRQALQQRLEGPGYGAQKRYELITNPAIASEGLGIAADSSTTRFRYNGSANWTLRRLDTARTVLTSGTSRITDGLNIINSQFFAADVETETVTKRIVEALADQIVTQVAIFLKRQATPPAK